LVLDEIRKKVHHEQLKIVEEDTVHTADAVLRGKITAPVLKARAKVLGELQVPLGHLHRLRSMSGCQLVSLVPSTDEPWVQTDLQLVPGSQFEIKASGTIYFEIKGLKRNAAPRGNEELRNIIDSMVGHSVGFAPGLVRGRIGTDGETFEIGKSYQGTASQEGRLYLQIYTGGPHEIPLSGSYQVEIEGY
jgi:hypothetical protein